MIGRHSIRICLGRIASLTSRSRRRQEKGPERPHWISDRIGASQQSRDQRARFEIDNSEKHWQKPERRIFPPDTYLLR